MKATRRRFWTIPLAALAVGLLGGPAAAQVTTPFVEATNTLGTNYFLGRTGMGTNQPGQMLHVVGDTRLQGGLSVDGALRVPKQGDISMGIFTNGLSDQGVASSNLSLRGAWLSYDGSAQGVYVATDGKVGVGTSAPSAALQVNGGGRFTDLTVDDGLTFGGVERTTWPTESGDWASNLWTEAKDSTSIWNEVAALTNRLLFTNEIAVGTTNAMTSAGWVDLPDLLAPSWAFHAARTNVSLGTQQVSWRDGAPYLVSPGSARLALVATNGFTVYGPTTDGNTNNTLIDPTGSFTYRHANGAAESGHLMFLRARGTSVSMNSVVNNDWLGALSFGGMSTNGSSTWTGSASARAQILGRAAEDWTNTAQGAKLCFRVAPTNSGTARYVAELNGDGVLYLYSYVSAPPPTPTMGALVYSMSGEVFVLDSAGNATQISPHTADRNELVIDSYNVYSGVRETVNLTRLGAAVESLLPVESPFKGSVYSVVTGPPTANWNADEERKHAETEQELRIWQELPEDERDASAMPRIHVKSPVPAWAVDAQKVFQADGGE